MNTTARIAEFSLPDSDDNNPQPEELRRLAELLAKYAPHDDRFDLIPDGVYVLKVSKTTDESTFTMAEPGFCIVAQGAKSVSLASNDFEYDESNMVVYAAEVPISMKITRASKETPYLCLVIPIDPHKLTDLIVKVFPNGVPKSDDVRAIYVGNGNRKILQSAVRMVELINSQEDVDLLVPLAIEEILIRLLRSPAGPAIAQIGVNDSNIQKIARAISWLKANFAEPVKMEELAKIAGMSISAFHTHFKKVTSMSPLQFQKTLRLHEARHLILSKMMDVSSACYEVGYSSVSQFSREYSRFYGVSPSRQRLN